MKGYGKRRHWACCPGHDADWKHTRKTASRKSSLRSVKKTARQQGKTESLSHDEYHEIMEQICDLVPLDPGATTKNGRLLKKLVLQAEQYEKEHFIAMSGWLDPAPSGNGPRVSHYMVDGQSLCERHVYSKADLFGRLEKDNPKDRTGCCLRCSNVLDDRARISKK